MGITNSPPSALHSHVYQYIDGWKSKLIDLSRRNRLIYFRPYKSSNLVVSQPNMQDIFDRLVVRGRDWSFFLPPIEEEEYENASKPHITNFVENRDAEWEQISRQKTGEVGLRKDELLCNEVDRDRLLRVLKNLYRRSRTDYQERGVRILYICFGMHVWKEVETSEEVHSPLLLVPIEITRESARDPFQIRLPQVEDEVILNPALQIKLQHDFNVELPPIPEDWEELSLHNYFDSVRIIGKDLGWSVEPTVLIGLFSFHKLVMYHDLSVNAPIISINPIILALTGETQRDIFLDDLPDEHQLDTIQKPEKTFQVLDADSSQQLCIQYALCGQSLVMHGPPGTGKSQTIANIIAEFIARGRTVLFVSEKMAALEVVFKRLKEVGLEDFCLELHSHKANKREIIAELNRSLNEWTVPKRSMSVIEFEKLTQLRDKLNDYVNALHEKRSPLEMSAYEVLSQIAILEEAPSYVAGLPVPRKLTPQRIQRTEDLIYQLKTVWQVIEEGEDFPWYQCKVRPFNFNTRSQMTTLTQQTASVINGLKTVSAEFALKIGVDPPSTLDDVEWLIQIGNLIKRSPGPDPNWLTQGDPDEIVAEAKHYQEISESYQTKRNSLKKRYHDVFFSLPSDMSVKLLKSWNGSRKYLSRLDPSGSELIKHRLDLQKFAFDTQRLVNEWLCDATEIGKLLGFSVDNVTPSRAKQFAQLALLCHSDTRPEASWLELTRLHELQNSILNVRSEYEEHNEKKRRLDEIYYEGVFTLEIERLIECYSGPYRSFLRWFRPSFYRDKKMIARVSRSGEVPTLVQEDLVDARRVNQLSTKLESEKKYVSSLIGRYYQGYNTDFDLVEHAIGVATDAVKLASVAPVPEGLVAQISLGSIPDPQLRIFGNRLLSSINTWEQEVKALASLVPLSRIPGPELPIFNSPLLKLSEWARGTEEQLLKLNNLTEEVFQVCLGDFPATYRDLITDLELGETLKSLEVDISAESDRLQKRFGARYLGLYTNWDDVLAALDWTRQVRALFSTRVISPPFVELVCNKTEDIPSNRDLKEAYQNTLTNVKKLAAKFEHPEPTYEGQPLQKLTLNGLENRLRQLHTRIDELQIWLDFKTIKKRLDAYMSDFLKRLMDKPPPADQLVDVFHKAIYHEWANSVFDDDPRLGEFRGSNHNQIIKEFQKLDRDLVRLSSQRVISEANNRKPKGMLVQARDAEISILTREAAKKRRHMPIRTLFERIPNLIVRLKPCLLMGPLSVSQFLPPEKQYYDIVIFDEASQICPEDAVGAIYRGKQIVVAGDDKQLPPTVFFQKSMVEEYDWDDLEEDEFDVFESILDECKPILPTQMLRWHYRSKHESLIAFSNKHFYNYQLVTFPSSLAEHDALGVKFVYVPDGIYDRGGRRNNPREAEVVADLVFQHFEHYPSKSLGVVAFSIAQADTIEEEIERRRRDRPGFEVYFSEDRLTGFFVKNLENVQGDERDIMIFSVGYGYDQQKRMTMNFGPLNKSGGERRLNVAITRAREKVILVSSIKASDIDPTSRPPGVMNLYHYLDYAERGAMALELETSLGGGEFESPMEEAVAGEIRSLGYDVVPQVGCSGYRIDLGVVDPVAPGRFILGVECDGVTYHSTYTARDRDRLRQQVLESHGWRIHRIWSPDWVNRRNTEIARLKKAIELTHERQLEDYSENVKPVPPVQDESSTTPAVEVQPVNFKDVESIGRPYKVATLEARFSPYIRIRMRRYPYVSTQKNEFYMSNNRQEQSRLLVELVNEEGPIHFDYAVKRLASSWGLKRTGSRIIDAVKEAVWLCRRRGLLHVKGSFLWPPELKDVPVRIPVVELPESMREIEYIPPEEIESAMKLIVKHAIGISVESLITETARVFGFHHTGANIKDRLLEVYETLSQESKLVCKNDIVTLPESHNE